MCLGKTGEILTTAVITTWVINAFITLGARARSGYMATACLVCRCWLLSHFRRHLASAETEVGVGALWVVRYTNLTVRAWCNL